MLSIGITGINLFRDPLLLCMGAGHNNRMSKYAPTINEGAVGVPPQRVLSSWPKQVKKQSQVRRPNDLAKRPRSDTATFPA